MYQQVESGRDSKKDGKRSLFGEEHETSVVRGSLLVLRCGAKPVDARCAKPALPYIMRLISFILVTCPSSTGYLGHPYKNIPCETEKDLHPLLANTGRLVYN